MALLVEEQMRAGLQGAPRGVYRAKELKFSACQVTKNIIPSHPNILALMTNHQSHCCHQKLHFLQEIFGLFLIIYDTLITKMRATSTDCKMLIMFAVIFMLKLMYI